MNYELLVPFLTLVLGWFLAERTYASRVREARHNAIRRILSELLEMRHRARGLQLGIQELHKVLPSPLPAMLKNQLRQQLRTVFVDRDLPGRYEAAVSSLSEHDPFLAFVLRGKHLALTMDEVVGAAVPSTDESAAEVFHAVQSSFEKHVLPALDDVVEQTAKALGWRTWLRAKRILSQEHLVPNAVIDEMLTPVRQIVQQARAQQGSSPEKPPPAPHG